MLTEITLNTLLTVLFENLRHEPCRPPFEIFLFNRAHSSLDDILERMLRTGDEEIQEGPQGHTLE